MPLFSSSILFPFCPPSQHPGKAARPFPYPQEHGATDLPLTENKTGIMFRKNRKKQNRNKLPTILQKKEKNARSVQNQDLCKRLYHNAEMKKRAFGIKTGLRLKNSNIHKRECNFSVILLRPSSLRSPKASLPERPSLSSHPYGFRQSVRPCLR